MLGEAVDGSSESMHEAECGEGQCHGTPNGALSTFPGLPTGSPQGCCRGSAAGGRQSSRSYLGDGDTYRHMHVCHPENKLRTSNLWKY